MKRFVIAITEKMLVLLKKMKKIEEKKDLRFTTMTIEEYCSSVFSRLFEDFLSHKNEAQIELNYALKPLIEIKEGIDLLAGSSRGRFSTPAPVASCVIFEDCISDKENPFEALQKIEQAYDDFFDSVVFGSCYFFDATHGDFIVHTFVDVSDYDFRSESEEFDEESELTQSTFATDLKNEMERLKPLFFRHTLALPTKARVVKRLTNIVEQFQNFEEKWSKSLPDEVKSDLSDIHVSVLDLISDMDVNEKE